MADSRRTALEVSWMNAEELALHVAKTIKDPTSTLISEFFRSLNVDGQQFLTISADRLQGLSAGNDDITETLLMMQGKDPRHSPIRQRRRLPRADEIFAQDGPDENVASPQGFANSQESEDNDPETSLDVINIDISPVPGIQAALDPDSPDDDSAVVDNQTQLMLFAAALNNDVDWSAAQDAESPHSEHPPSPPGDTIPDAATNQALSEESDAYADDNQASSVDVERTADDPPHDSSHDADSTVSEEELAPSNHDQTTSPPALDQSTTGCPEQEASHSDIVKTHSSMHSPASASHIVHDLDIRPDPDSPSPTESIADHDSPPSASNDIAKTDSPIHSATSARDLDIQPDSEPPSPIDSSADQEHHTGPPSPNYTVHILDSSTSEPFDGPAQQADVDKPPADSPQSGHTKDGHFSLQQDIILSPRSSVSASPQSLQIQYIPDHESSSLSFALSLDIESVELPLLEDIPSSTESNHVITPLTSSIELPPLHLGSESLFDAVNKELDSPELSTIHQSLPLIPTTRSRSYSLVGLEWLEGHTFFSQRESLVDFRRERRGHGRKDVSVQTEKTPEDRQARALKNRVRELESELKALRAERDKPKASSSQLRDFMSFFVPADIDPALSAGVYTRI